MNRFAKAFLVAMLMLCRGVVNVGFSWREGRETEANRVCRKKGEDDTAFRRELIMVVRGRGCK